MEINQETLDKLKVAATALSKVFNAIYEALMQFTRWLVDHWKWIKEKVMKLHRFEEKRIKKKQLHRMNFTRSKIFH